MFASIVTKTFMNVRLMINMNSEFQYKMLDRMRSDCEYYLGFGNRSTKYLWGKSVEKHIEAMRRIWNELKEKPAWLSMEQIDEYEEKMKEDIQMKTWKIPVCWTMMGTVNVEANTLAEAIEIAKDDAGVIPIPDDGTFMDGSWEVDCFDEDYLREWYNGNQKDNIKELF